MHINQWLLNKEYTITSDDHYCFVVNAILGTTYSRKEIVRLHGIPAHYPVLTKVMYLEDYNRHVVVIREIHDEHAPIAPIQVQAFDVCEHLSQETFFFKRSYFCQAEACMRHGQCIRAQVMEKGI